MWINYLLLASLTRPSFFFFRDALRRLAVLFRTSRSAWKWNGDDMELMLAFFFSRSLSAHHHKQSRRLLMIIICSLKCYFLLSSRKRDYLPSDLCPQKPTWSLMISFWKGGERCNLRLRMEEIKRPQSAYWIEEAFVWIALEFRRRER